MILVFIFVLLSVCCFADYSGYKLKYRADDYTYSLRLYTSANAPRLAVRVNGNTLYAPLSTTKESFKDLTVKRQGVKYYVRKSNCLWVNNHGIARLQNSSGTSTPAYSAYISSKSDVWHYADLASIRWVPFDLSTRKGTVETDITNPSNNGQPVYFFEDSGTIIYVLQTNKFLAAVYTIYWEPRSRVYTEPTLQFYIQGYVSCCFKNGYLFYYNGDSSIYCRELKYTSTSAYFSDATYFGSVKRGHIAIDSRGNIWSCNGTKLYCKTSAIITLPVSEDAFAIAIDSQDNIYVPTSIGLYVYGIDYPPYGGAPTVENVSCYVSSQNLACRSLAITDDNVLYGVTGHYSTDGITSGNFDLEYWY